MKHSKILIVLLLATFAVFLVFDQIVNSQGQDLNPLTNQADKVSGTGNPVVARQFRFGSDCGPDVDDQCPVRCPWPMACPEPICEDPPHAEEAPTGFDDQTNGLVDQDTHDRDRDTFE